MVKIHSEHIRYFEFMGVKTLIQMGDKTLRGKDKNDR